MPRVYKKIITAQQEKRLRAWYAKYVAAGTANDIAEELGVTENYIYQWITRERKKQQLKQLIG